MLSVSSYTLSYEKVTPSPYSFVYSIGIEKKEYLFVFIGGEINVFSVCKRKELGEGKVVQQIQKENKDTNRAPSLAVSDSDTTCT